MIKKKVPDKWIKTKADERAIREGCYFDKIAGLKVIEYFYKFLRHSKGEWSGKPYELLKWQADDVIMPLFSWKCPDGRRRFRSADIWVPKKNGKSTLAAGLTLYMLTSDGESGAEIYSAANDREQASIIFRECEAMVLQSPQLLKRLEIIKSQKRITYADKFSFYKALSADVATKEGLNPHFVVVDELHAMKTRTLWDALYYAGIARRQSLKLTISTAGDDELSIGYERYQVAKRLLNNEIDDPTIFAYIKAADPDKDDWMSPKIWKKANPSYGIIISEKDFKIDCEAAQNNPAEENIFKRYRLNIWTKQTTRFIPIEAWDKCCKNIRLENMGKDECFGGLDLSSRTDLTAFALDFPYQKDGKQYHRLFCKFYIPEKTAKSRQISKQVYYLDWQKKGLITLTPGDVLDYEYVINDIIEISKKYNLISIGFDPWNATQTALQLREKHGINMIEFRQGMITMNEPTKNFFQWILSGQIEHDGNELLRWNVDNLQVKTDVSGNMRPVKPEGDTSAKIDGAVASIMAIAMASVNIKKQSIYEERGLITL